MSVAQEVLCPGLQLGAKEQILIKEWDRPEVEAGDTDPPGCVTDSLEEGSLPAHPLCTLICGFPAVPQRQGS